MRLLKLVCCLLLLTAFAAGQNSSSPNPQATSPQTFSANPETGTAGSNSGTQVTGEIRFMTRYTEIGGDETRSFRTEGLNNVGEFNYFIDRPFFVTHRVQLLSMYRATDDHSIDPERNSLQKAFVRFFGPRDEVIIGDALVNLSRLAFNQNIKGLATSVRVGDHWKISAVGGIFTDRYGSLFKDLPGRPFTSAVAGGRLEYSFNKDSLLGFNFSNSNDLVETLPTAAAGVPPFPATNRVGTIDTRIQKKGFRFEGEFAYSLTDFDSRFSGGCTAACDSRVPQPFLGDQGDWAGRAEASWRKGKFTARGSYARYQPNFASFNARQIADLEDIVGRASYELTSWMTADGTIRRSQNDLRDQLPFRTRLLGPEAKLVLHDLPGYKRAVLEVGYRERLVDAIGAQLPGAPERFVRMPFAELTLPMGTTFLTFGYERRQAVDEKSAGQTSNTNRFYGALRGMWNVNGWTVNPSLRFELERQAHRPNLDTLTYPDGSLLPLSARLLLNMDSNRLGVASIFVEAPKYAIFELAFRNSSATIAEMFFPTTNTNTLRPAGFSRPSYRAAMTYKVANSENLHFIFAFERNSNFYFTSKDFDERMCSVTLVWKFGNRAR